MKYSVQKALSEVRTIADIIGKTITLKSNVGLKKLGALDYLKKNGYRVTKEVK